MNKYTMQSILLNRYKVTIYEVDIKDDAFCLKRGDKYYIALNKNKNFTPEERYFKIEHELSHIMNNTFYNDNNKNMAYQINQLEIQTNDYMLLKNGIASRILSRLNKGLSKDEIINELELPQEIYDLAFKLLVRRDILNYGI